MSCGRTRGTKRSTAKDEGGMSSFRNELPATNCIYICRHDIMLCHDTTLREEKSAVPFQHSPLVCAVFRGSHAQNTHPAVSWQRS